MAKKPQLTDDEVVELFSQLDESGVLDPVVAQRVREGKEDDTARKAAARKRVRVDPLSQDDPSGSKVGETISRTAILCIVTVLVLVVGMQIVYGVNRRLNTANLSERADVETVTHALESGVEWGNGFTQFPAEFSVDEADEKTGVIEVSVLDAESKNELELLSNSQIQASALSTNALVNDKINRVVYNVYARVDSEGNFVQDRLFGFIKGQGTRRAMLTFIWSKQKSPTSNYIDWELRIVGMDEDITAKIQDQVNSVSSIAEDPALSDADYEDLQAYEQEELAAHDGRAFTDREGSTAQLGQPERASGSDAGSAEGASQEVSPAE